MNRGRCGWWLVVGLGALVLLALASLMIGSRPVPPSTVLAALRAYDPANDLHLVVWKLRVPRLFTAVLAGAALGLAGAIMQAVTRNPLAEPGLLGINAGAAVAVVLGVTLLGLTRPAHYVWLSILGAGLAGTAVFLLGRAHETGTNPVRLVLAGAGLSVVLVAVTGIVVLNAPPTAFDDFRHWAAGSVQGAGFETVTVLAVMVAAGFAIAATVVGGLDVLALGQELGRALGAAPPVIWLSACLAVMLLAGAATAAAGPVAFVGLIAPHLARTVAGPSHRAILPCSALFAALLLLGSDLIGRVVAAPAEIAVGIVVALLGGPFFIAAVRRFRVSRS